MKIQIKLNGQDRESFEEFLCGNAKQVNIQLRSVPGVDRKKSWQACSVSIPGVKRFCGHNVIVFFDGKRMLTDES